MQQQSQMGMLSMILGIIGLLMTFVGCGAFPVLMLAAILCGVAIFLATAERKKIAAGEVDPQGAQMALVGQITGGMGCGIQALAGLALAAFVLLYVGFIILMMLIGIVGAAAGA